jgi:hypothetical protein
MNENGSRLTPERFAVSKATATLVTTWVVTVALGAVSILGVIWLAKRVL